MNNPFDEIRRKREAEAVRKQMEAQARKQAEQNRADENTRLFQEACAAYSAMVTRVLNQLREALYKPDVELNGPRPFKESQNHWETPDPWIWRPVWSLTHTEEEPISDTGPMTTVTRTDVQVTLDFDKKKKPYFTCMRGYNNTATCPATEQELIKTLTKLHF
jgi:hypothetical protein